MKADTSAETSAFEQFALSPFLQKTIDRIGFTQPTPIQRDAIPLVLEGKDVMGLAQTGTGKTVAFVLPLIQQLVASKEKGIKAVILTPTRELADQVDEVVKQFLPRTGLKSTTIYGGVSHRTQMHALRSEPGIIVACPGRLLDHVGAGTIDLGEVSYLVLDEADRMLDMGFMPDIKKIIASLPKERQTLMFSATMPKEIAELSEQVLRDPMTVRVKSDEPVALVEHAMFTVKKDEKQERFINFMKVQTEAVSVVFTKMKFTAKRLGEQLTKAGVSGVALHGNLSQAQRKRALQGFRDGKYRVLIATDIASRGIDVQGITHVVNYDMPDTLEAYIHRTGRVGRASNTGEAISFVMRSDRDILRSVEKWLKRPLERLNTDTDSESDMTEHEPEKKAPRRANDRDAREGRRPQRKPRGGRQEGARAERRSPVRARGERSQDDRDKRSSSGERSERGERRDYRGGSARSERTPRGRAPFRGARSDKQPRGNRSFRGQQDIDQSADYVYRESKPVFIERFEDDGKRRGPANRGQHRGGGEQRRKSYDSEARTGRPNRGEGARRSGGSKRPGATSERGQRGGRQGESTSRPRQRPAGRGAPRRTPRRQSGE